MAVKERLEQLAKAGGYANPSALARAAGITEGAMRQHIARDSVPHERAKEYIEACPGTGTTVDWLMYEKGPAPRRPAPGSTTGSDGKIVLLQSGGRSNLALRSQSPNGLRSVTGDVKDGKVVGPTPVDFPVYSAADAGGDVVSLSQEPEYYVGRPNWSKSSKDFSYFVNTDTMGPHPKRGDRVEVNFVEPPVPGDLVVLICGERDKDWKALLRELVEITDTHWRAKQYHPEVVDNFSKELWRECLKVSGIHKR